MASLVKVNVPEGKGAIDAAAKAALRPVPVPAPPVIPNG